VVALSQQLREAVSKSGAPPVEGLVLGPLIGRGSFRSVHLARWKGKRVACKVGLFSLWIHILHCGHNGKEGGGDVEITNV